MCEKMYMWATVTSLFNFSIFLQSRMHCILLGSMNNLCTERKKGRSYKFKYHNAYIHLFMYRNICMHNTPLFWHLVFFRELISSPSPLLLCRITIMKLGLATLEKHLFNPPFQIQLISAQIISREQLRPLCQQPWRSHKQEDNKKSYYQLGDERKRENRDLDRHISQNQP